MRSSVSRGVKPQNALDYVRCVIYPSGEAYVGMCSKRPRFYPYREGDTLKHHSRGNTTRYGIQQTDRDGHGRRPGAFYY
jgi:hypothetical protein